MADDFRLFGGAYVAVEALWALRWLSLAQLVSITLGPGAMVLQVVHEEVASIWILAAAAAVGLPLTWALGLQYGIAGAAIAKIPTLGCVSGASYVVLRTRSGVDMLPWGRGSLADDGADRT